MVDGHLKKPRWLDTDNAEGAEIGGWKRRDRGADKVAGHRQGRWWLGTEAVPTERQQAGTSVREGVRTAQQVTHKP